MNLLVLNGPNIARLGTREPSVYGSTTWEQLQQDVVDYAASKGFEAEIVFNPNGRGCPSDPEPSRLHALQLRGA